LLIDDDDDDTNYNTDDGRPPAVKGEQRGNEALAVGWPKVRWTRKPSGDGHYVA